MQCPRCQYETPPGQKFCGECGTPLSRPATSGSPGPSYADLERALSEVLEQQTATAEILRVIGSSPSDLQPVFDSILENAMRLCDASLATVGLYDGKRYRHVAQRGGSPEYVKFLFEGPFEPNPQYTLGRMIAERQPFHVADYRELPGYKEGNPRSVATVEVGSELFFPLPTFHTLSVA